MFGEIVLKERSVGHEFNMCSSSSVCCQLDWYPQKNKNPEILLVRYDPTMMTNIRATNMGPLLYR